MTWTVGPAVPRDEHISKRQLGRVSQAERTAAAKALRWGQEGGPGPVAFAEPGGHLDAAVDTGGVAGGRPPVAFYKVLWLLLREELEGAGVSSARPPSPPHSVLSPGIFQNMEKVVVPSVTLIVGCGVSSLTLLMLIIIYVSVWRWCPRGAGGVLGQGSRGFPGRGQPGSLLTPSPLEVAVGEGAAQRPLVSLLLSQRLLSALSPPASAITDGQHPHLCYPSPLQPPTCCLFQFLTDPCSRDTDRGALRVGGHGRSRPGRAGAVPACSCLALGPHCPLHSEPFPWWTPAQPAPALPLDHWGPQTP